MAVRAVICDWGGTLTPWRGIDHDALWRAACAPHFPPELAGEVAAAILAAERYLWQVTERSQQSATLAQIFERAGVTPTRSSWSATSGSGIPHSDVPAFDAAVPDAVITSLAGLMAHIDGW